MTEPIIHPDDPLFLVSRRLDGDLSDTESRSLAERLVASAELADAAKRMESLDQAIRRATPGLPALDWTHELELTLGRIADDVSNSEDQQIDTALERWAHATSVKDVDLAPHVITKLAGAAKQSPRRRLVLPWAVPLAAAAAIAMIVMGPWFGGEIQRPVEGPAIATLPGPVVNVVMGPQGHTDGSEAVSPAPSLTARAANVVVFDRGSAVALISPRANRDMGFITVGVAKATLAEEVPPL